MMTTTKKRKRHNLLAPCHTVEAPAGAASTCPQQVVHTLCPHSMA